MSVKIIATTTAALMSAALAPPSLSNGKKAEQAPNRYGKGTNIADACGNRRRIIIFRGTPGRRGGVIDFDSNAANQGLSGLKPGQYNPCAKSPNCSIAALHFELRGRCAALTS